MKGIALLENLFHVSYLEIFISDCIGGDIYILSKLVDVCATHTDSRMRANAQCLFRITLSLKLRARY